MATSALSISESARARKGWVGGSKSTGKQCAACCSRGMAKGLMPTIASWGSFCRTVVVLDLRAEVVQIVVHVL